MECKELASYFDHTFLKAYATESDFIKLCNEAKELSCRMVAINSYPVKLCKELLKGTEVHVGAAIGFPLGQTTIKSKLYEAKNAINDGADEIDYVINVGEAKMHNWNYIEDEMKEMTSLCHGNSVIVKVIFENCYLEVSEIIELSKIAKEVEPDYIKTSTGFGTGGATIKDVKLMKQHVGDIVQVKAAGGIRDLQTCLAMIDAGATRIGTSSSVEIINELMRK